MKNNGTYKIITTEGVLEPPVVVPFIHKELSLFAHNRRTKEGEWSPSWWDVTEKRTGRMFTDAPALGLSDAIIRARGAIDICNRHTLDKTIKELQL